VRLSAVHSLTWVCNPQFPAWPVIRPKALTNRLTQCHIPIGFLTAIPLADQQTDLVTLAIYVVWTPWHSANTLTPPLISENSGDRAQLNKYIVHSASAFPTHLRWSFQLNSMFATTFPPNGPNGLLRAIHRFGRVSLSTRYFLKVLAWNPLHIYTVARARLCPAN
jgi:hypothetical protein